MPALYHQRTFRKCPFCENECKRTILTNGRNKGFQKTCGSKECVRAAINRPEAIIRKTHRGSEHPRWITDRQLVKFRPRYEMTLWRITVFERDNYTCQTCGVRGGRLQAHHIFGYKQFPEKRWDLQNGITLCESCHKKTNNYGSKGRDSNSCEVKSTTDRHGDSRA